MKAVEESCVDYYHFEQSLTPAEQNVRIACEKRAKEREVKWAAWAEKGQLPGPAVLKRAVRKVSTRRCGLQGPRWRQGPRMPRTDAAPGVLGAPFALR